MLKPKAKIIRFTKFKKLHIFVSVYTFLQTAMSQCTKIYKHTKNKLHNTLQQLIGKNMTLLIKHFENTKCLRKLMMSV